MTHRINKYIGSADMAFLGFLAVSVAVFWRSLSALVFYALDHEYCSHVVLIPAISLYLVYLNRDVIRKTLTPWSYGALLALPAIPVLCWTIAKKSTLDPNDFLVGMTFSIVCIWISGFAVCYGARAFRAAIFPLCFLFLMVPLPLQVLREVVYFLQKVSTDITAFLLQVAGQPLLKTGFTIDMPRLTIVVAEECSGIRSSLALFITCLLAGHWMLKSNWRRILFVLAAFPVAALKNGIRIATLVLLSLHVDMRFMTGSLHREGGFVFFIIAILIMFGLLKVLQKSESGPNPQSPSKLIPIKNTIGN